VLAITVCNTLIARYGAQGYQNIRAALNVYAAAAQAHFVVLDDPNDEILKALSLQPAAGVEAGSLLLPLCAVRQALGVSDSILLVGGDSIVPHWRMTNPVTDRSVDPDETVMSDNPYGTDTEDLSEYLAPPVAVGRLTDFPRGTADEFVKLIRAAAAARQGRPIRNRSAVVSNADWANYSQKAAQSLPGPDWHLSPGYAMDQGRRPDTDREFLYFNLHGFTGEADWKGYDTVREQFVTAVTPDAFDQRYVSGAVVFAENCYGAETPGRTPQNSCALRLVHEGAAFVGATGLAFGSHLAPNFFLDDADALACSFWSAFTGGAELGESLRRARLDYRDDSTTPETNPFKQKTLLQFILLGDPGWN